MARNFDYTTALGISGAQSFAINGAATDNAAFKPWTFQETSSFSFSQFHMGQSAFSTPSAVNAVGTSPNMLAEVTFFSGVTESGNIAAKDFMNWKGNNPATYEKDSGETHKWEGGHAGTSGGTVYYYFSPKSDWTATEKSVFVAGLTLWSDIADIKFKLTTDKSQADVVIKRGSDGSAWEDDSHAGAAAIGSKTLGSEYGAEISIDTSVYGFGPITNNVDKAGGYVWGTIVHEEGHLLGLGHAGAYNGDVKSATQQFSAYDTLQWSIMSYIEPQDTKAKYYSQYTVKGTSWDGNDPTTPQMLDYIAAQRLYGVSTSKTLAGGQTFGFNCNITDATKPFFDFTVNKTPVITIWDSGDHNTIDLSGFTKDSTINLNAGTFSSCDGLKNNIGIAFNTWIDHAIGGSGDDTIIANTQADVLNGGTGADTYVFQSAADSTGSAFDTVDNFNANGDFFNVSENVTGIDHALTVGALSSKTFDSDLALAVNSDTLAAHHAVEFTPTTGTLKGDHFLIIDVNGHAGYQAGQDLVIELSGATHLSSLSASDFVT